MGFFDFLGNVQYFGETIAERPSFNWLQARADLGNRSLTPQERARNSSWAKLFQPGETLITGTFAGAPVIMGQKVNPSSELARALAGGAVPEQLTPFVGRDTLLYYPTWYASGVGVPTNTREFSEAVEPYNKDMAKKIADSGSNSIVDSMQNLGLIGLGVLALGAYFVLKGQRID